MIHLLSIISLLITSVYTDDCYFRLNSSNNECMFRCSSTKYIAKTALTFDQLKQSCGSVKQGAILGDCSSTADLVWSDSCTCPYCKCSTKNAEGTAVTYQRLVQKTCYNCTCDTYPYDTSIGNQLIFSCDNTGMWFNDPYNWDDFSCPSGYCMDSNGNKKAVGEGWPENVDADAKCLKYCYCGKDGTTTCINGFHELVASTNDGLWGTFVQQCGYYMRDCLDEPNRMFTTDVGPTCSSCPKCNCNGRAVGDTWYTEYKHEQDGIQNGMKCIKCECKAGSSSETNYAHCQEQGVDTSNVGDKDAYPAGYGSCPGTTTITCHEENVYSHSNNNNNNLTVGTLNSEKCYLNQPEAYCSWEYDASNWDWNCDKSLYCAVYGTNNQCIYSESTVSYSYCDGSNGSFTMGPRYLYCCNGGDNCNYKNIDLSECTQSTDYGELFSSLFTCLSTSSNSNCYYYEQETITCDGVREVYKKDASCYCGAYSKLYANASSKWKTWIEKQIDMFMSRYSQWNDVLGCEIELKCDLSISGGNVYNNKASDNKIYFVAVIFTALVVIIMNN